MNHSIKSLRILFSIVIALVVLTIGASATDLKLGVGIVQSSSLRVRSYASTDASIVATASCGDTVVVLAKYDDWYLVNYNLDIGYMYGGYVEFKSVANAYLGDGVVNCSSVNVRTKPSTDSDVAFQLSCGDKAKIIGINETFYKVTYGDQTGYVRSDLMDLTEPPLTNSVSSNTTVANGSSDADHSSSDSSNSSGASSSSSSGASSTSELLIDYAESYLGTPYVWGGTTPSGFDCSGFTQYVYRNFGISINRTADAQMSDGYSVDQSELQPGDLIFFCNTYSASGATHVGIYIGNGQFIHAGGGCVKITDLSSSYYASRYYGARRILS